MNLGWNLISYLVRTGLAGLQTQNFPENAVFYISPMFFVIFLHFFHF